MTTTAERRVDLSGVVSHRPLLESRNSKVLMAMDI